jgi:hypothetical protein
LKAKSVDRAAKITDSNLACADVRLLNGERLNGFLREANLRQPVCERLVRTA